MDSTVKNIDVNKIMFWHTFSKKMGKPVGKMWSGKKREGTNTVTVTKKDVRYGRDLNGRTLNELYVNTLKNLDDTGNLGNISNEN